MTPYLFSILDGLRGTCFFAGLFAAAAAALMIVGDIPNDDRHERARRVRCVAVVLCTVASVVLFVATALIPTRESWTEAKRVFQEEGGNQRTEVINEP